MLKRFQLWLYARGWALALTIAASFMLRKRMSHNNGLVASGRLRIVDNPRFPAHDFLVPGRQMKCRLRHASVSYDDDTIIQVRSASLKFADSREDSPLDLEMNTGTISLFWTARNFFEFAFDRQMKEGLAFRDFYRKYPRGLLAAKEGIRKSPSSFADLKYHSQCTQAFTGKDGVRRYCRFRLIPDPEVPETGLMRPEELENLWVEVVAPGETRSPHYLKREFAERLARGPVRYRLQMQLHTPTQQDSEELFNCNVAWDEASHPYVDVAEVEVDTLLPHEESEWMVFSVGHHPPSLALLPAKSLDDYNSVNYLRAHSTLAKRARLLAYKLFGMPKPLPERETKQA